MKAKLLLTVFGVLNVLQGLFLFFNADNLSRDSFPGASQEAINTAVLMHYPFSAAVATVGVILLFLRSCELSAMKKALMGYGVGVLLILISVIGFNSSGGVAPLPLVLANAVIMLVAFYGSVKAR